jgi:hypothetical protein
MMRAVHQLLVQSFHVSLIWVVCCTTWVGAEEAAIQQQVARSVIRSDPRPFEDSISDSSGQAAFAFEFADWLMQPPAAPPVIPPTAEAGLFAPRAATQLVEDVFASEDTRRSLIADYRQRNVPFLGTELVFGSEGRFRITTDSGDLLGKSLFAPSVKVQNRSPAVAEPRIRSHRNGRLLASGSHWAPARDDLDTALSKIDSQTIRDVVVIKGPYTTLLGPGFCFVDFEFAETPRTGGGYQWGGSNALEYETNGQQFFGRQTVLGGAEN